MPRTEIDGDQIQDGTVTGADLLDGSVQIQDLQDYSFQTLSDVDISSISPDDLIVYSQSLSKFVNKSISDIKLFYKKTFGIADGDINIPQDKILQMHSPSVDGCIEISGELYLL